MAKMTVNKVTGLTPQQEKVVNLLVGGKSVTDIAKELDIDRTTLYEWSEKINFQAYFNKLRKDVQEMVENNLFSLYEKGLKAINDCLDSTNPSVRLKAAFWLVEKLQGIEKLEKVIQLKSSVLKPPLFQHWNSIFQIILMKKNLSG